MGSSLEVLSWRPDGGLVYAGVIWGLCALSHFTKSGLRVSSRGLVSGSDLVFSPEVFVLGSHLGLCLQVSSWGIVLGVLWDLVSGSCMESSMGFWA